MTAPGRCWDSVHVLQTPAAEHGAVFEGLQPCWHLCSVLCCHVQPAAPSWLISAPRLIVGVNPFQLTLRVTPHSVTWGRTLSDLSDLILMCQTLIWHPLHTPKCIWRVNIPCAWHSSLKTRPNLHLPAISISFVYLFCKLFMTWTPSLCVHVRHAKLQDFDLVFSHEVFLQCKLKSREAVCAQVAVSTVEQSSSVFCREGGAESVPLPQSADRTSAAFLGRSKWRSHTYWESC